MEKRLIQEKMEGNGQGADLHEDLHCWVKHKYIFIYKFPNENCLILLAIYGWHAMSYAMEKANVDSSIINSTNQ